MKLYNVLKDSFNVNESEMKDKNKINDYGEWESMSHMYFITKLEEAYNIEFSGDEIANMQTVGDIKKIITSKGLEL